MKTGITILITVLTLFNLVAQPDTIDRLKNLLKTHTLGKNDSLYNQTLIQLVHQYRNYDVPKAIKYANNAIELAQKLDDEDRLYFWYGTIGELYILHDEQILALEAYGKGLKLAQKRNANTAWWYINIGNVYFSDNLNLLKAEKNYARAILEFQKLDNKNSRKGLAVAYNNIGLVHESRNNYHEAINNYRKALEIRRSLKDNALMRHSYTILANAFINLDYDSAEHYFDKVYKMVNGTSHEFDYFLGVSELYRKEKKYKNADKAIESAEQIALDQKLNRLLPLVYHEYAQIDLDEGKLKQAMSHAKAGLDYAQKEGLINYSLMLLELIMEITESEKDYKKLAKCQKMYIRLEDSLHKQQVKNAEINFELEENNNEIHFLKDNIEQLSEHGHQLEEKNETQHEYLLTFEWGMGAALVSLFFLWLSLRKQKKQRRIIEVSHQEIVNSINYAHTIQNAILPRSDMYDHVFDNYFLLYEPKENLSGDFHYLKITPRNTVIAIGDCTGHGVPGAMLSILGINNINDIIRRLEVESPADVLDQLKYQISSTFGDSGRADGMDLAFMAISHDKDILQYSGATIPIYIVRDGKIRRIKATRSPIGQYMLEIPFENHVIPLKEGDKVYVFTDGFPDQFGGTNKVSKKYSRKRLIQRIEEIAHKPMSEQKMILKEELNSWKGNEEQIDDITVFGFEYKTS